MIFTEGSGLNDSVFGKSQAPIRMFLEKRGEAFEQQSAIKDIFKVGKSKHYAEKITSMTAMEGFQPVGENGAYPIDDMQEGYSKIIEAVTWKDSFSVSREMIEDSVMLQLQQKPLQFLQGYYRTRERFASALIAGGISGTTATFGGKTFDTASADGVALFSTSHPSKVKGGNQSNKFSNAFSADALGMAEERMQNFKGDNGELLDVAPDTILIPNSHALKKSVFAAIGADKDPATANNGFNYQFGRWNVIVWPYLPTSAGWMLLDSRYNENYGGLVWFDRVELTVHSDIDLNTDANVWRGRSRFNAGFNDWRAICVGGITGGTEMT